MIRGLAAPVRAFITIICLSFLGGAQGRAQVNVSTNRNDNSRTGANTQETVLTPANVNSAKFGKLYSVTLDGQAYAQPLVLTGLVFGGVTHNVVYVATEHDSLYAIDADTGAILWQLTFLVNGATTVPAASVGINCGDITPEYGITGTPVIDPATNTVYVVVNTIESGNNIYRLHAIDAVTEAEKFGGPMQITGTVAGTGDSSVNGHITFDPVQQGQRAGLLLNGGHVIVAFGSHCDHNTWHGWTFSYSAGPVMTQEAVWNTTPNGGLAGIWQGGVAPAADAIGNTFVVTGNGTFSSGSMYGDSIIKLGTPSGLTFPVLDFFTPFNQGTMETADEDLGSSGAVLLPDVTSGSHPHLLVHSTKIGTIYLVDRDNMGHYCNSCGSDPQIVQEVTSANQGVWGGLAYWNGSVYMGSAPDGIINGDHVKAFSFNAGNSGLLSTSFTSETTNAFGFTGPTPSVSANGASNGILWFLDNTTWGSSCCAVLYAYDATNLNTLLYNSSQAGGNRDQASGAIKFTTPTIANGKVFAGGQTALTAYGLFGPSAAAPVFTPPAGNYPNTTTVGLSDTTPGAIIHCTTDGVTVPNTSSPVCSSVQVSTLTKIQAMAEAPGYNNSYVASATYTIGTGPTIVGLSISSGVVGTPVTITGVNFGTLQGSSSVTFNGTPATPTSWGPTSIAVPVPRGATSGLILVTVASSPSNGVPFTVVSLGSGGALLQHASKDAGIIASSSLAFPGNNTAGNLIVVCIRAGHSGQTFTVTDSRGNNYQQAVRLNVTSDLPNGDTLGIYYAEGIKSGSNTVTVSESIGSNTLRFAILEYTGVATSGSLDGVASTQASGTQPNSGNAPNIASGDLLVGAIDTGNAAGYSPGSGYVIEESVPATPNAKLIAEDSVQSATGPAFASATLGMADAWGAGLAAFKMAGGGGGTTPSISNLNPASGAVGVQVIITGSNFGSPQGSNTVTFGGVSAGTASVWSASSITVNVPTGALTGNVIVTVGGQLSNALPFTVLPPPPAITSLSANSGVVGTQVIITGTGFGSPQGSSTVTFGGVSAGTASAWSDTSITVNVPTGALTGNVVVTVGGQLSNGSPFTVAPTITSLSTSSGPVGAQVVVTGLNFGSPQGSSTVTFGGISVGTASAWSTASITVNVPSGALTGSVIVTVGGQLSNALPFTVLPPPPVITSLSANSGPVGTQVIITGSNFGAPQGSSTVTFGGVSAGTATAWTAGSITVNVPTGALSGNVIVTVGGQLSNGLNFTVIGPPPAISGLAPTSGLVGTPVTITGSNFGAVVGSNTVKFNGTSTTPSSWSDISIVAPVPLGATSGNVVVNVGGQNSNGVNFNVTPGPTPIKLIQHINKDGGTTTASSLAFVSSNTVGNWIAVCVRAGHSGETFSVSDSHGNTYHQAVRFDVSMDAPNGDTVAIFYAENIVSGTNTVTVTDSTSATLRFAILEYSGVATANSLEATALAQGSSAAPSTASATTLSNGDLLLGAIIDSSGRTLTAGSGFTLEDSVPAAPNTKLIVEDRIQTAAGSAVANATLNSSDIWGAVVAAFKPGP